MSRYASAKLNSKMARAKRDLALERGEFRLPSEPREAPASPTSFPIKIEDQVIRALIDAELMRRATGSGESVVETAKCCVTGTKAGNRPRKETGALLKGAR